MLARIAASPPIVFPQIGCSPSPGIHPDHVVLSRMDREWITSRITFPGPDRMSSFLRMAVERWTLWCYPGAATERAIDIVDLITLLFALDDLAVHHPAMFAQAATEHLTARSPSTPYGRALAEVLGRLMGTMSPGLAERVLAGLRDHLEGAVAETHSRPHGRFSELDEYLHLRRASIGGQMCAALAEHGIGVDLTQEMAADADLEDAWIPVTDHWILSNDLFSLNKEITHADTMNVVMVLMHQLGVEAQVAVDQIGDELRRLDQAHATARDRLRRRYTGHRRFGDIDKYLDALDHMLSGNLRWSYETHRYDFRPRHTSPTDPGKRHG